ncbi:MAG: hypothetical protein AAGH78_04775 [Cyanobacteria bacterium P01_H01_bin.58]
MQHDSSSTDMDGQHVRNTIAVIRRFVFIYERSPIVIALSVSALDNCAYVE